MKTLIDLSTKIFDVKDLLHKDGAEGDAIELIEKVIEDDNGNILTENGIPKTKVEPINGCSFNFNRDVDKLCFKNALARFLRTGSKEDAFDVYFCYSEIFSTFGGYKKGNDSLLELLYQHEASSATLLTKHRDHYSHSVYVFALGLAIFMNNENMRNAFGIRYGEEKLYEKFLEYWGMAGLFHDIGYPYEISFLEVLEYGKKIDNDKESERLKMQYSNLQGFIALSEDEVTKCSEFMPEGRQDLNALFASEILKNFGDLTDNPSLDLKIIENCLSERITQADKFMDHGYFSAVLFLKKLLKTENFKLDQITLDAIMAMLLHNSFYKRTYKSEIRRDKYEQMHINEQPLAYLLMLCDELQCWDRAPYGEVSKKQELAWDVDFYVTDRHIDVDYYFEVGDKKDTKKIKNLINDINNEVVNTCELAQFNATMRMKRKDKKVYDYFSDSRFISLCKIAETININYMEDCNNAGIKGYLQNKFDYLTLEYKLSNIAQAKNYVRHLQNINCFFSDRQLDYLPVQEFTEDELDYLAVDEHIRWVNEKVEMGWKYGTDYKDRVEREQKRIHKDIIPYADLTLKEKKKDYFPINNMVKNLDKYGIKIYRMDIENKPKLILGCTGHRDLSRIKGFDEEEIRTKVRTYIRELKEKYKLTLYSGFADGADLLFAEEAIKCGIDVIAVLPCSWKAFMKEHTDGGIKFMQILGQTKEVKVKPNHLRRYEDMSRYIIKQCDEMLVLWDGIELPLEDKNGNELNRGGTYDTLVASQSVGKKIVKF